MIARLGYVNVSLSRPDVSGRQVPTGKRRVRALKLSWLSVTRAIKGDPVGWNVTHIDSGIAICAGTPFETQAKALAAARRLDRLPCWAELRHPDDAKGWAKSVRKTIQAEIDRR